MKIEVNASILCAVVTCEQCNVKMKSIYRMSKNIEEVLLELMADDWNRRATNE